MGDLLGLVHEIPTIEIPTGQNPDNRNPENRAHIALRF